jgi:competence ComEA-like helix-hairpin-helix protein
MGMKQNLPYNLLLAITVAVTGLAVLYNLFWQESFPVIVRYEFPQVRSESAASSPAPESSPAEAAAFYIEEQPEETQPEVEPPPLEQPQAEQPEDSPATAMEYIEAPVIFVEPETSEESSSAYIEEPEIVVEFPLNLNTATYEELILIPRVGDVTAQRILQYRDYLGGGYDMLEQLMEIKGIGEATFEAIEPYLYVE